MTTPEENAATCREFNKRVFNEGDISYAEKMISDDFVDYSPMPGSGKATGDKASTIEMFRMMHEQFPESKSEIQDIVASENKVMVRTRISGTDTKGFMLGMPATGKPYSMETIDVMTFDENGLNTEHYGIADISGAMMQLGLMPPPPGAG
jgi:steroid delta-isomerase-like uncharacterized protein